MISLSNKNTCQLSQTEAGKLTPVILLESFCGSIRISSVRKVKITKKNYNLM